MDHIVVIIPKIRNPNSSRGRKTAMTFSKSLSAAVGSRCPAVRGVRGVMPWPARDPEHVATVFGNMLCGGTFDGAPRWAARRGVDLVVNCREVRTTPALQDFM